jgi:hypothetical protein
LQGKNAKLSKYKQLAKYAPLAQWIECWPPKPKVTGSNPVGRANPSVAAFSVSQIFIGPQSGVTADFPGAGLSPGIEPIQKIRI